MSDEVVKQAAMLGVQDAFGAARETLKELTLLELSHSSIHKASQMMGEGVIAAEEALKQHGQDFDSQLEQRRSQQKPQRLYGSMDGFMVPLEDGWYEMKAGAWWTTRTRRDGSLAAQDIHYYVDLQPTEQFSDLVWATGFAHPADQAQQLVFVADGADWIWRIVDRHYPQAIQIVDWYHACQYIAPVAQLAFKDPAQRQDWIEQMTDALWVGDPDTVISACALYVHPDLKPEDDPAQKAVTYYTNNRHRMDYPAYRDQDLMIGSGSKWKAAVSNSALSVSKSPARVGHLMALVSLLRLALLTLATSGLTLPPFVMPCLKLPDRFWMHPARRDG